jgi:metal-responsive CopG/Arc/MetJ family transcriptional regulator
MNGLSRETRLQIMLDDDELAAIDDWRFKRRMPSRAAAIRDLLRRGLQAELGQDTDRSRRSEDFGVIGNDAEAES